MMFSRAGVTTFASQAAMACKPSAKRISSQRSAMATPASVWCLPSMVLPFACITARASTQVAKPSAIPEASKRFGA